MPLRPLCFPTVPYLLDPTPTPRGCLALRYGTEYLDLPGNVLDRAAQRRDTNNDHGQDAD